jgi:SSS family solute:Na+ symporter
MTYPLATIVFSILIASVLVMGFAAGRVGSANMQHIKEWGLAGRQFGTWSTWFLLGGDIYTAYTFVAIPALVFGAGAIGFFAVPYTLLIYPLMYIVLPKFWRVARRYGYITGPEFVRGRYGNRWLALAVGITGIIATIPYIALQLKGLQIIIGALGIRGDFPVIIAFAVVAGFTHTSGLRAPAVLAVVKDLLIYLTVIVAIIIIPIDLGGFGAIFAKISPAKLLLAIPPANSGGAYTGYATLAIGSAMALFLYPHIMTAVLSASSQTVLRRNAAMLPAFTIMLGLLALMGFMALAAGVGTMPQFAFGFQKFGANFAIPALVLNFFPSWFAGVAFGAIAIGAMVPAAIMAIAAATIFSRDIYSQFSPEHLSEVMVAKIAAITIITIALLFVMATPTAYAVEFQLLGGMWIIQTFPAVVFSVFTRFFNGWALLAGWAVGIVSATMLVFANRFTGSISTIDLFGFVLPSYIAFSTVIANALIAVLLSLPLNIYASDRHRDQTTEWDYF